MCVQNERSLRVDSDVALVMSRKHASVVPAARRTSARAWRLCGGCDDEAYPCTALGDTWEWDGVSWVLASTSGPPMYQPESITR